MRYKFLGLMLIILGLGVAFEADAQVKTALLESRRVDKDTGIDNYENATFSFEKGMNGVAALKVTRNDWDVLFSTIRNVEGKIYGDYFDVTMVVDDRSRIVDLGKREWEEYLELPDLPAYEKPTREMRIEARVGHMYYVHTADTDSDHYSLFRVEELKSGESVAISWKLVGPTAETSK